jgi:hypothetical protein
LIKKVDLIKESKICASSPAMEGIAKKGFLQEDETPK